MNVIWYLNGGGNMIILHNGSHPPLKEINKRSHYNLRYNILRFRQFNNYIIAKVIYNVVSTLMA